MGKHKHNRGEQQGEAVEAVVEQVEAVELTAEQVELAKLEAEYAVKLAKVEEAERTAWEQEIVTGICRNGKVRRANPQLVLGSLRTATEAEAATFSHCHGQVAEIRCAKADCSATRLINKQDAFQSRYCKAHLTEGRKAARKEVKEIKQTTPEAIKASIAAKMAKLDAKLAKLTPAPVAEATDTASAG